MSGHSSEIEMAQEVEQSDRPDCEAAAADKRTAAAERAPDGGCCAHREQRLNIAALLCALARSPVRCCFARTRRRMR